MEFGLDGKDINRQKTFNLQVKKFSEKTSLISLSDRYVRVLFTYLSRHSSEQELCTHLGVYSPWPGMVHVRSFYV